MAMAARRPRLLVYATGGTIASRRDPETGAVAALATSDELLAAVPALAKIAEVGLEPVAAVNGWNVTPELMFDLAGRVGTDLADPAIAGAVVTHGTDTVEETALVLDLLVRSDKPVVFAVALRHLGELGSDGPRNLRDATLVAVSPLARGWGALVVANQTIHAARRATKTQTTNPGAFASPGTGPVGSADAGEVRFHHPPVPRRTVPADRIEPAVFLHEPRAGDDDRVRRWALAAGYRGIVVEGSGAGNVPATVVPGIAIALAAGVPVVLCARCVGGRVAATYRGTGATGGASGGGHDLAALGVIPAHGLTGQKARVQLMVALGAAADPAGVWAISEPTTERVSARAGEEPGLSGP